ncbi:MAG: V-type ATPase subunit, partial [Clostridia bacterium]|nr:V-type ATPase subunit [Clostridia bacterium]
MRDTDYAYAVARIRSNESRLLTAQDIDALIASGSAAKCMAQLSDRGWDGGAGQDEASMLAAELRKTWELIDEVAPDSSVFDSFRIKNDFHNLKAALKGRLAGCEWKHLCMTPATVDIAVIEKAVREKAFSLLPEAMRDSAAEAYNALVEWGDGQLCEMILDRASLESAIAEAKKTGGLVLELAELGAFESDIRIAARCAAMKKPLGTIALSLA